MIRFSVSKFRCFYDTDPIPISPVTVLVGENSTGKTSYLAALRTITESLGNGNELSFNRDPFHLGAFDQIVNVRRGSREGRPIEFSFRLSADVTETIATIEPSKRRPPSLSPALVILRMAFRKSGSQPVLSSMKIAYHDYSLELSIFGGEQSVLIHRGKDTFELPKNEAEDFRYSHRFDMVFFTSFLQNILEYRVRRHKRPTPAFAFEAVRVISEAVGSGFSPLRRIPVRAIAPIRSKPRRTYDPKEDVRDAAGEYVPYRLARMKHEDKAGYKTVKESLEKFGAASGLFDTIEIKQLGKMDSDPFQIIFKIKGTSSNLVDVGYGVSQAVPLVTDMVIEDGPAMFLIQQPEVHLHPRAQSEFATFVKNFAMQTGSFVIMETHSDYILDRLRTHVRMDKDFTNHDLSVIYFERQGQTVNPFHIEIGEDGDIKAAPKSYREFFLKEEMRTLGLLDVPNSR